MYKMVEWWASKGKQSNDFVGMCPFSKILMCYINPHLNANMILITSSPDYINQYWFVFLLGNVYK